MIFQRKPKAPSVFARDLSRLRPLESLPSVPSASLGGWTLNVGDTVHMCDKNDSLTKVSDIKPLNDNRRFVVKYTWHYTRNEIKEELKIDGTLTKNFRSHLN